jgi:branched-chain amino acid transport system permease protein
MMNDANVISMPVVAKKMVLSRWLLWGLAVVVPLVLPLVFDSQYATSLMSQIGIAAILALSYNMLLGQTGLLSFGQAVYSGLGGFATIHALNAVKSGLFYFPVTLLPLVGELVGLCFGVLFGYVTTKRAGTVFAMITMGIAELVGAASLVFPGFGGEGGISGNRVVGTGLFGIDYGSGVQVFYLILAWMMVCMVLMYALTRTPLGRMANAVRDNTERVEFVGYNPQRVRYLMFVLASFFAGIGGGLTAINYEIVSHEYLSSHASAGPLLMAYIGGAGFFLGPVIGAIIVTFLQVVIGAFTKAWPIYMGTIFICMVLFAPHGVSGVVMQHRQAWKAGLMHRLIPAYLKSLMPAVAAILGAICLVESIYHLTEKSSEGPGMSLFGISYSVTTPTPWLASLLLIAIGIFFLHRSRAAVAEAWEGVMEKLQGRKSQ